MYITKHTTTSEDGKRTLRMIKSYDGYGEFNYNVIHSTKGEILDCEEFNKYRKAKRVYDSIEINKLNSPEVNSTNQDKEVK